MKESERERGGGRRRKKMRRVSDGFFRRTNEDSDSRSAPSEEERRLALSRHSVPSKSRYIRIVVVVVVVVVVIDVAERGYRLSKYIKSSQGEVGACCSFNKSTNFKSAVTLANPTTVAERPRKKRICAKGENKSLRDSRDEGIRGHE